MNAQWKNALERALATGWQYLAGALASAAAAGTSGQIGWQAILIGAGVAVGLSLLKSFGLSAAQSAEVESVVEALVPAVAPALEPLISRIEALFTANAPAASAVRGVRPPVPPGS